MRIAVLLLAVFIAAPTSDPATSRERVPGAVFDDCEDCPEMVVVKGGTFTMGSSDAQQADESPKHRVSVRNFALGEYDVTRAQYAAFVQATGYNTGSCAGNDWENAGFPQTGEDPVVCVSWQDAQAYIAWLNTQASSAGGSAGTGPYRLPTEAEWEYAARGGNGTRFWWGETELTAGENAWYSDNSGGRTHPVGMKLPNPFGLFDVVGNVWEWTQDCYAPTYAGAPSNGTAVETPQGCERVNRGGSWRDHVWMLRSSARAHNPADTRDPTIGLRVVRDL